MSLIHWLSVVFQDKHSNIMHLSNVSELLRILDWMDAEDDITDHELVHNSQCHKKLNHSYDTEQAPFVY